MERNGRGDFRGLSGISQWSMLEVLPPVTAIGTTKEWLIAWLVQKIGQVKSAGRRVA